MKGVGHLKKTVAKAEQQGEMGTFTKRIGSTVYKVCIHFDQDAKETINDKIIRLVHNDTAGMAAE